MSGFDVSSSKYPDLFVLEKTIWLMLLKKSIVYLSGTCNYPVCFYLETSVHMYHNNLPYINAAKKQKQTKNK